MKVNDQKIKRGNIIKWLIWIPWIAAIILLAIKSGGYQKVDFFYKTTHGFSIGNVHALFIYLAIVALIVVPAFLVGKRSFCHSICWMAPFMILGRKLRNLLKLPSLQLFSIPEKCIKCHICTKNCPMSLPVQEMVNRVC